MLPRIDRGLSSFLCRCKFSDTNDEEISFVLFDYLHMHSVYTCFMLHTYTKEKVMIVACS